MSRAAPAAVDKARTLLGTALHGDDGAAAAEAAIAELPPGMLDGERLDVVAASIRRHRAAGDRADLTSVVGDLRRRGELERTGGELAFELDAGMQS